MAAVAGGDAWRITGEERAKHDAQFFTLKPINGYISGDQARGFFMQSGLPTPVLGQIWSLADMNNDGKMDKKEFSIAMHLIKKKLQGYELPKALPTTLKADPSPMIGSFGTVPQPAGMVPMGPQMGMPTMGMVPPVPVAMGARMPMMANGISPMVSAAGYIGAPGAPVSGAPAGFQGAVPVKAGAVPTTVQSGGNYAMPHPSKLKYTQMFNSNDRNKKGTLTGVEARAILVQTGVPQQMLAQIWNLSDVDKDGKLSCDEFCIAMHLTDLVRMGTVLPAKLPPELMPTKGRSGSFGGTPPPTAPAPTQDNFGDLLGGMGMPPPIQPATNGETNAEDKDKGLPFTFEDKRKENFDKGQAELEKRRQMLQEQMRREEEARQEKERKEHEKRERQRQEQEMKKQQELERQMEKQRQIERQREEQRQKMMEQRESARRELDRQRQMEWERQRKEQLMAEKSREYEQLMALKSQTSNLTCELESLQGKKTEITTKISQVRNGVTDFTAHIEAMRSTRDLKLADIERLQKELQELSQKWQSVQSERQELDLKVQTSIQNNPMSETHRTMMHSVELKRTSVQRLKKDMEEIEKETETKLTEIDQSNNEIKESDSKIQTLQADIGKAEQQRQLDSKAKAEEAERVKKEKEKHEKLRKELEAQRLREEEGKKKKEAPKPNTGTSLGGNWFDFGGDTKTSSTNDNWASVFDSQPTSTSQSSNIWNSLSSQTTTATTTNATDLDQKKIKLSGPTQKYKALYQFDARNVDELSLLPGDIVMVFDDQTGAEPGWKGGEINGKSGWFPEAYVEKVEESSQTVFGVDMSSSTNAISTSEESSFMAVPGKMPSVSPTPGQGKTAPDGLQAQALYPWKAKKENHLTFNKGDIILVREQQDMWWSGDLAGKVGWFPKSYVKLISGPTASSASNSLTNSPSMTPTSTLEPARDSPSIDKKDTELYVAVYPYHSEEPGDLTFNAGEIIHVTKMEGDWWTGSQGERTGIFPANYVKKSETQPLDSLSSMPATGTLSDGAGFSLSEPNGSPFPHDPFKDSSVVNDNSLFNAETISESLSPTVGSSAKPNDTGTNPVVSDPFASLGSVMMSAQTAEITLDQATPQASTNSVNISSDLAHSGSNPFPAESFSDLSSSSLFQTNLDNPKFNTPSLDKPLDTVAEFGKIGSDPMKDDLFADMASVSFPTPANAAGANIGFSQSSTPASVEPSDTEGKFGNVEPNPIADDPFADLDSNSAFPKNLSENLNASSKADTPASGSSNATPQKETLGNESNKTAKSDDSFADFGTQLNDNPFPSDPFAETNVDPFAGPDVFGTDQAVSSSSMSNLDLSGNAVGAVSSPDDKTDRYAAFAAFEDTQQPSDQAADFPAPPTNWFASVEKNALTSDHSDLVGLTGVPQLPKTSVEFSIQTSVSVSIASASPEMSLQGAASGNTAPNTSMDTSVLFSSTTGQLSDSEPPSLPKKHGPPRPPPVKRSTSKADDSAGEDTKNKSDAAPKQGTLKKPEIATVIASYTATGPEQLSLNPGQLIQVRKKSSSGWWEGELQARGQKRKIGWFPANYVKLLGGSARSTPDNTLGGGTRGISPAPGVTQQDNRSSDPSPAPQSTAQQAKYVDHVIALYPYKAQHADELTFLKDAVINVIKKEGVEWWQGECNGQIGMFPANYVSSTSPDSTSWSTDPSVLAVTSSEEGKRQSYIHELINTEESYMEDMSVVMDAFYKPMRYSGGVLEEHLQAIFVNWQELIICNTKFLKALRVRKKMCGKGQVINMIGDMLCENIPHMKPYIRFCSCQLNAAALLQRLTENSSQFREIHKKCVQNSKTKGMPLSSFLLKPMQRITKYPLIVEKILKYTPESHPDQQQLVDALDLCQELCSQVNEGVREKENSDRLEWIQQHVQCDGLPEKITFNSVTNCLGPRKILHNGVLCKAKSNKELGAFLFNDFLLLTTSNRPLNSTHSLFDVTGQVQYKMYKMPVFLNEVMVKKPADEDDVFQVSLIERVYNLRCHSQNDRDTWVKKLETASRHYLDTERKKRDKALSSSKGSHHVGRLLVIIIEGNNLVCSKDVRRSQGVGRLLVVIMEGIDLMASDDNGKSDPYCEVSMGSQEHKTKVINNTLNPKWNASMQFSIQNVDTDTLCITVFDRDLFSPNDFLGRTEIQVKEIMREAGECGRRPIIKHLLLHEVSTGEVVVKLDLHLFDQT